MFQSYSCRENVVYPIFEEKQLPEIAIPVELKEKSEIKDHLKEGDDDAAKNQNSNFTPSASTPLVSSTPVPSSSSSQNSEKDFLTKLMKKIDRKIQKSVPKRKCPSDYESTKKNSPPCKKKKFQTSLTTPKISQRTLSTTKISKDRSKKILKKSSEPVSHPQLSKRALDRFEKEFLPSNLSRSQKRIQQIKKQGK